MDQNYVLLETCLLDPSPLNPRCELDEGLSGSLIAIGQLEPIVVRPSAAKPGRYEIANGHRRWKGAIKAGMKQLGARVLPLSDAQMLDIMLGSGADGNQRPLNALEEGIGYATAHKIMGGSLRDLAAHFGINTTTLQERLSLVDLPEKAKQAVVKGELPARTASLVARINEPEKRAFAAEKVVSAPGGVMSFAATKAFIEEQICKPLRGARFDQKDAELLVEAGPCTACKFNSAVDRERYHDATVGHCMSPSCFEKKVLASRVRVIAKEEKAGKKLLEPEAMAAAFPAGENGVAWNSGYVEWTKQPGADLLKKEVAAALQPGSAEAAMLRVPTWKELCDGPSAVVQVWIGFDQSGRAVDLVRIEEALLAADENERAIFNQETIRHYNLDKGAAAAKKARDRKPVDVKAAALPDKPAEKESPAAPANPPVAAKEQPAENEKQTAWVVRAVEWIRRTIEATTVLPPLLRENGFQLLREVGADTHTQHPAAHEVVEPAVRLAELRQRAEDAFDRIGIQREDTRNRLVKVACAGVARFDLLTTPEQFERLLALLEKKTSAP